MSLLALLAQDLRQYLGLLPDNVMRQVLLWLDPEDQFRRLVPYLASVLTEHNITLLRLGMVHDQGQFGLKLALLRLETEPHERAVVYLPGYGRPALGPQPDGGAPPLWGLYEYRFKGCVWGLGDVPEPGAVPEPPTLLAWLRHHGLTIADDKTAQKLATGGRDGLLARYAEKMRDRTLADWPRPLRESDVLAALGGDPRDTLRRLLMTPADEVARWGGERMLVLGRLADEYGLALPDEGATPEMLVDAAALQLALAEAWETFGRPKDFPFRDRLPRTAGNRRKLAEFLRDEVLSHTELRPRFRVRLLRLESGCDLSRWAADHPGQPRGLPLLARTRWQHFLGRFDVAAEHHWQSACELLQVERDTISAGAASPWDGLAGDSQWAVLANLAALAEQAGVAVREVATMARPAELVAAYAELWWRIDQLHLRLLAAAAQVPGLEQVRRVADLACFDYAARVNQRLTDLVEQEPCWPPAGTTGVEALRSALWGMDGGRRAVIIADACRWDIAEAVRARLTSDCKLTPVMSTLPSETPFGMTALLPLAEQPLAITVTTTDIVIRQGDSADFATRDGRKQFLAARLVDRQGKSLVDFIDLLELLRGARVPKAPVVVVFDNDLDEQGHKGPEQLPALVEQFAARLQRAIDQLHTAGIAAVHLVTDHGFLLLPGDAVDALGRPEVLPAQARHKSDRWAALKPEAPVADVIRLPLPLAPAVAELGLPRGLRTLMKAPPYLHGGLSLQECVIPHLVSRASMPQARLGLDLRVTNARLVGGTVPVVLKPVLAEGQTPLGGIQPLRVRLIVEAVPAGDEPLPTVAEPVEVELRLGVEELRPPVYLREGLDLRAGQELLLSAVDAETGEELARLPLTLLVDWE